MVTDKTPLSAIELLLGQHPKEQFFGQIWEKQSLHIVHNDPDRFRHVLDSKRFLEEEVAHCRNLRAIYRNSKNWSVEITITADQVKHMHEAGHSICATMLREEGSIKDFLDSFRNDIYAAGGPHLNVYYSPDKTGASLHFDTHPVWLIQIEGSKNWLIGRTPTIKNPMYNCNFPPDRDVVHLPWATIHKPDVSDSSQFMSLTLTPGDVIYLPPGTWHHAEASGGSFALTLAQARVTAADLFFTCLQQKLQYEPQLVERIHGISRSELGENGYLSDELETLLTQRLNDLHQLLKNITMKDIRNAYHQLSTVRSGETSMITPQDVAKMLASLTQRL